MRRGWLYGRMELAAVFVYQLPSDMKCVHTTRPGTKRHVGFLKLHR